MTSDTTLARTTGTDPDSARDLARVVESLVTRGDTSGLTAAERARHYLHVCGGLGLNPQTQPFAYLKLNGKEVLYATRGATDQLAAMHRLNREIIDGPRVIDLAGTKLVYAVCRATHPNGRVETAVATVPFVDPVNVLMKAETKCKRRATLSILGLGLLDEMELETIPANTQEPAGGVDLGALAAAQRAEAAPSQVDDVPTPPADAPPALEDFYQRLAEIELPGESIAVWMRYRADLATLDAALREGAWKALCARTETVGKMKNAKVWLKKAIAEEDARRSAPVADPMRPDDDPPPGGPQGPRGGRRPTASAEGTSAPGPVPAAAPQARWEPITTSKGARIESALAAEAHLSTLGEHGVRNSFARHHDHRAYAELCVAAYARVRRVDRDTARYLLDQAVPREMGAAA